MSLSYSFSIANKINVYIENNFSNKKFNDFIENAFLNFDDIVEEPLYNIKLYVKKNNIFSNYQFELGNDMKKVKNGIVFPTGHEYYFNNKDYKIIIPLKVKRGRIPWRRTTPGRHVVDEVLEPFLQLVLNSFRYTFLHASCILEDKGANISMGWRHSGKTEKLLPFINDYEIWSDDFIILSDEGKVYPYPRPIRLYSYNLPLLPINKKQLWSLKLKSFFTPPWQPVKYWNFKKPSKIHANINKIELLNNLEGDIAEMSQLIMNFEHNFYSKEKIFLKKYLLKNIFTVKQIVRSAISKKINLDD